MFFRWWKLHESLSVYVVVDPEQEFPLFMRWSKLNNDVSTVCLVLLQKCWRLLKYLSIINARQSKPLGSLGYRGYFPSHKQTFIGNTEIWKILYWGLSLLVTPDHINNTRIACQERDKHFNAIIGQHATFCFRHHSMKGN